MKHHIPGHPAPSGRGHPSSGNPEEAFHNELKPENRYHPAQVAWLTERGLYTGRMVADVSHLPAELRFLSTP